jgi:cell division protein FtsQ
VTNPPWRVVRLAAVAVVLLAALTIPLWAPMLMRRMAYFHVRRVEIVGAHYLAPREILTALHVDTTMSVWDATAPLERRLQAEPEIQQASVRRKLPGTLVVTVAERVPVALVPTAQGFRPLDAAGATLPLDPSHVRIDAPVIAQRDTTLLHLLGDMKNSMPELYRSVSVIRPEGPEAWRLELASVAVLAMRDVTLDRLAEIAPVERDLASRQLRAAELDLRYRDQVIARLP